VYTEQEQLRGKRCVGPLLVVNPEMGLTLTGAVEGQAVCWALAWGLTGDGSVLG